jgi:hypothetical protein
MPRFFSQEEVSTALAGAAIRLWFSFLRFELESMATTEVK